MNIDKTPGPKLPSYLNEFKDCFGEIGCLCNEHHIVIDNSVPPTVNLSQRIPIALKEKVNNELQRMLKINIIAPIEETTDRVNSMEVVEQTNSNLTICIDPRKFNKAIKRPHYAIPTTEEILSKLGGAKRFLKLNANNAYSQIPFDENTLKLLTFNSPTGRY